MSPAETYRAEIERGLLQPDPLQAEAVQCFERLYQSLMQPRERGWLWFKRRDPVRGLYVYGSVGRGKTHLMDLFYDCLPAGGKLRQHYHEFMLWLHGRLRAHEAQKDPLNKIIAELAQRVHLVCLDEFLVNDIADAMLLSGILKAMHAHGITLVTTSNVKPDDLYREGLQRARFKPAIQWINAHMQVMHLDGETDHRMRHGELRTHWYYPLNESSEWHLQQVFAERVPAAARQYQQSWNVNGRPLPVVACGGDVLWCGFDALCREPRNADDYLKIAAKVRHLMIQSVPILNDNDNDAARRLITLIDVMYESRVHLMVSAAAHHEAIYRGDKLAFEFTRANSRLRELLLEGHRIGH